MNKKIYTKDYKTKMQEILILCKGTQRIMGGMSTSSVRAYEHASKFKPGVSVTVDQ